MDFLRKPNFVEIVLTVLIVTLGFTVWTTHKKVEALQETMRLVGMSDELVTEHMTRSNKINFKLLERIEKLEEYDRTQVEFNEHILDSISNASR